MRNALLAGAAAFALVANFSIAEAVDVFNEDLNTHVLLVDIDGNENTVEVLPGDTLTDICQRCVISIEDGETIEVEGDLIAVVKNGKLRITSKIY